LKRIVVERPTGHDDQRADLLVEDARVAVERARHEEPRAQAAQDLLAREQAPDHVEPRRALDRRDERVEPPAPVAVEAPELREPRRGLRERDELVGVERDHLRAPPPSRPSR
jgi:hypothetical protein